MGGGWTRTVESTTSPPPPWEGKVALCSWATVLTKWSERKDEGRHCEIVLLYRSIRTGRMNKWMKERGYAQRMNTWMDSDESSGTGNRIIPKPAPSRPGIVQVGGRVGEVGGPCWRRRPQAAQGGGASWRWPEQQQRQVWATRGKRG